MKVEFTKELETSIPFGSFRAAYGERKDNLRREPSKNDGLLLEKLNRDPKSFLMFDDFVLLTEMAALTDKLWKPGKNLLVYFMSGEPEIHSGIMNNLCDWSSNCSIRFSVTKNAEEADIRIDFDNKGSWSYIGTDALLVDKSQATMNFGWIKKDMDQKEFKQIVLHEFGHALGLIHEHQSPAIKMNWNKIYVYNYFMYNYGWPKEKVDINLFQEFETTKSKFSQVDVHSIMAYSIPPEFTINRMSFPLNYELSQSDKKYIGEIYP